MYEYIVQVDMYFCLFIVDAWQAQRHDERLRKESLLNGEQRATKGFLMMVCE